MKTIILVAAVVLFVLAAFGVHAPLTLGFGLAAFAGSFLVPPAS